MEYCSGGDLCATLEREPHNRLPEVQALPLFKQIVRGVRFLHANGIAHRDLSRENVLLGHNNGVVAGAFGTPNICDFGMSTDADQTCRERVGKAYYMAPEVVAGDAYNPRAADMWSLGIILFVMLTGSPLTPLASEKEEAFVALKEFGVERIVETWLMSDLVSPATMDLLVGCCRSTPSLDSQQMTWWRTGLSWDCRLPAQHTATPLLMRAPDDLKKIMILAAPRAQLRGG